MVARYINMWYIFIQYHPINSIKYHFVNFPFIGLLINYFGFKIKHKTKQKQTQTDHMYVVYVCLCKQ